MKDATTPKKEKSGHSGWALGILAACLILAIVTIVLGVKVSRLDAKLADTQTQLTQAKSDASKAQTGLDKANAQAADLQTQLDKAKAQAADLQSKADQSKDAATQLQAQLDRAKTQAVDLQAQIDKANAKSADLQNQVTQANAGSSQLLTQLDQAKIHSMDVETRLQKAEGDLSQLQPLILKARHMPVTTSFEKVHGNSFTLHVANLYLQPLSVQITINGQNKTRSQSNTIGSGGTQNVEKLAAGENVVIASEGYDPVNLTVQ